MILFAVAAGGGISISKLFLAGVVPGVVMCLCLAVAAYLIIQALDGNLLAPLLFSEAVDLHPVAIIVAILFFGGLWGFWGVFFAIPLATVIQAILRVWPRAGGPEPEPLAAEDGDQ